jgi:hypothetical protein
MWVSIHKCIETMLGISQYSYLFLKLEKMLFVSYYRLYFVFNKIRKQEGRTGYASMQGRGGREVTQAPYTHVSKCENDKIEKETFL